MMARLFEQALPRLASANVAVSTFTADRLREGTGTQAYVIPNGIDVSAISAAKPSSKTTDIIFVGRLMREKRVALLLDAVRKVSLSVPNVHVEIIGDGPERHAIGELARALPANVRVDLVSRIADATELYCRIKSSKMLVLPSEREGYGLVVAEAQACGTVPIVVRGTENASLDLIEPDHTGIIVEADADELARVISTTMRDPEARKRIGERARTSSSVRDWQYSAAATSSLYQALLRGAGNHAATRSNVIVSGGKSSGSTV